MKKILYFARFNDLDPVAMYGEDIDKWVTLVNSRLLISTSLCFPRNIELPYKATYSPMPTNLRVQPIISFEEATNKRAMEVAAIAETNDLPIVVYWSGGIDSTVILSALFKLWPQHLIDRIYVRMTNASYVENPQFFNEFIKNKVTYGNSNKYHYGNAMVINGNPADALWLGGNVLSFRVNFGTTHDDLLNIHGGKVIDYFTTKSDRGYAEWLYQHILMTANVSNMPIVTLGDMFWWLMFNYIYSSMCTQHLTEGPIDKDLYEKNFVLWFDTLEYQAWSYQSQYYLNNDIKFDGTIRSYKMPAKQYIYDFDGNQYYRDYKTKVHSSYKTRHDLEKVKIIYDDFTYEVRE